MAIRYDDSTIDTLIWDAIADSTCPEDFRCYLRHKPEGAAHFDAALDRLIELDDSDISGPARYALAIAAFRELAGKGDRTAQFHMGRVLSRGVSANFTVASHLLR